MKIENQTGCLHKPETRLFRGVNFSVVPALFAAVLPKCPLCFAAYISIFGGLGISPLLYGYWILPVTFLFSAVTIALLYFQARRNQRYFPFLLSLLAPPIILAGKFYLESVYPIYAGTILLLISSVWLSVSKKSQINCNN